MIASDFAKGYAMTGRRKKKSGTLERTHQGEVRSCQGRLPPV